MVDAISSGNPLFRGIRRFHLWLGRLSHRHQFAIIFGAWLLVQIMTRAGQNVPWLVPLIPAFVMAYLSFAVLTWTSDAIFNTFLRFHPFGRHLLTPKMTWRSNLVASFLISAIVGAIYAFVVGNSLGAMAVAFYWLMLCVPAAAAFSMPTLNRGLVIGGIGLVIACIPIYGVIQAGLTDSLQPLVDAFRTFSWSTIGLQVVANYMLVAANRR